MEADEKKETTLEIDNKYRAELSLLFQNLRANAFSSIEYFQTLQGSNNERFYNAFCHLFEHLRDRIEKGVDVIMTFAHRYDIDENTRCNGYRSLIKLVHKCAIHVESLCRYISINKVSFLFRASHYSNELEAYVSTLGQLGALVYYAQQIVKFCEVGQLFAYEAFSDDPIAEALMAESEAIDQIPFYGRCLSFQFCESMKKPFTIIHIAMASYSENYENESGFMSLAGSILDSGKYLMDPDLRAQQIVNTTRNVDINFCKSFWSLTESNSMKQLPAYVCPNVEINETVTIPAESFTLPRVTGVGHVTIHPPTAHIGPAPVYVRLISHKYREGQLNSNKKLSPQLKPSPYLLFHVHGGGFVAQSSKSHEVYLRGWAADLQVPILSVDYSLAPECPFPRALEEIFFAYSWAVKNCHLLGSTCERICFTGDSAGGNLVMATALKCISKGIRPPDGVVALYTPLLIRYIPSPSRMLSLVDPLLPVGITARCLAAYAGIPEEELFEPIKAPPQILEDELFSEDDDEDINPHNIKHVHSMLYTHKDINTGLNILLDSIENEDDDKPVVPLKEYVYSHSLDNINHGALTSLNGISKRLQYDAKLSNTELSNCEKENFCCDSEDIALDREITVALNNQNNDMGSVTSAEQNIQPSDAKERFKLDITTPIPVPSKIKHSTSFSPELNHQISPSASPPYYAQTRHFAQSPTPLRKFRQIHVSRDPYLSPLLATPDLLQGMPPVYLVVSHLDPLLDDSIAFAKKMRLMNKEAHLCLLDDLPHGFLNFALVSKECKQASDLCVTKMKEVFNQNGTIATEEEL